MAKATKILGVSSIILLGSILSLNSKIMAIGLLQYVIILGALMCKQVISKMNIREPDMNSTGDKMMVHLVIPLTGVGIVFVLLSIGLMFFL